ncbi:cell division protein FtsH [Chloroflexota bacterium]
MFKAQQVTGPVAPGQYGPMQVSGPSSYYPQQTDQMGSMFSSMMPMIMMIMMMAMIMPMMKGVTAKE